MRTVIQFIKGKIQSAKDGYTLLRQLTPAHPPRQSIGKAYGQYLQRENAKVHAQAKQACLQRWLNRMWQHYTCVALIVVNAMQTVAQSVRIVAPTHKYARNPYDADEQLVKQIHLKLPIILKNGIFMYRFHGRKYADCDLSASDLCKELQFEIDKQTNWYGLPRLICNVSYSVKTPRHYLLRLAWQSDCTAERDRRNRHAKSDV